MLSSPHADKESNPLVDGTLEVLEREDINESIARRRGVWFRTKLEDRTRS